MRDPLEFRMYEDFLKKEVGNVAENNEKTIHVAGIEGPVYTRTMTKTCTIVVNKLPADLRFCIEVDKFRDQIRAAKAVKQELHLDEVPNREFLEQRSTTIVSCFLNSNIPPAVQINITDQDAARIHAGFGKAKVKMALFHYPFFRIMPILIRMWKKFRFMTVFYGKQQKLNLLEKPTKKVLPHCNIPTIDYTLSTVLDYKYIFVEEGGSRGNSLSPVAPAARATSISQEGGSETQGEGHGEGHDESVGGQGRGHEIHGGGYHVGHVEFIGLGWDHGGHGHEMVKLIVGVMIGNTSHGEVMRDA
ncbi:hypothetical protein V1264_000918 [Littorina saxatilis]|uniref:Uncharacterized protein n=1 Tax=Littorina saxatilis TaxID=31220 RepID=A0AAN9C1F4_9CAEN